ncbi:MAG: hypothetical protein Aureis2KO_18650 [Aureisphaera sp.]
MSKHIKYILVGLTVLSFSGLYGQNCWDYEEHVPINRVGGTVVISEVYFDTHYSERIETKYHHIGEYIELFNSSTEDIDISGWRIKDHTSEYTFPNETIIDSGDFLVVTYAGRVIDNRPGTNFLFDVDKFVDLFPESAGFEDQIILQNNFVLHNPYATIELFNKNAFLIDQVKYTTQGPAGSPECAIYNFCGDLDNGDGGVFNGPIYVSLAAQLEAQGFPPTQTERYFKKSIHLQDRINYYDHHDLLDIYVQEDGTPFSLPFPITLQQPTEALDAFPPPPPPSIANFSTSSNHIYSESFNVYGEMTSKSGAYFNGMGKPTVNYFWDKDYNKVWGTQVKYDRLGRVALETLPAPSCDGFVHDPRFIYGNFNTYVPNDSDYDYLKEVDMPVNTFSSLRRYYSNENTNEKLQATTSRPYFRTVYDRLNPGRVMKTIGGNQIDGEWKTGYTFEVPAAQEMYYVFGSDYFNGPINSEGEEVITKYTKNITLDVQGNELIEFLDTNDNVIARARSGGALEYEVISVIGDQGYVDVHIPYGVNSLSYLTSASDYTIYDLKTGNIVSSISGGNVYRISSTPDNSNPQTYISSTGAVVAPSGTKGVRYNVNYIDYELYYYDDIGRLKMSTPPIGFDNSCLTNVQSTVSHNMATTHSYNALGLVIETETPDEGFAKFKYRSDGQMRFSQNSEQALVNEVAFTDYDTQARPIRSGVGTGNFTNLDPASDMITVGLREIHETLYDIADPSLPSILSTNGLDPLDYTQSFLSDNVSMTKISPSVGAPATSTTWYNYDAYGRIKWSVQDIDGLGLKTIHYSYDHNGNLKDMIYQKDDPSELFVHRYTYNLNNVLLNVATSRDGIDFKEQANYDYFKSGQLKRIEIADGLQGTDYVYALSGLLKSINDPSLNFSESMGGDVNDIFGITLDYYNGDYLRNESPIKTTPQGGDRYDGNVKAIRWSTKELSSTDTQDAYLYSYNPNNWLSEAIFGSADSNANILESDDYKVSNLTYDSNGNIITLNRTKNTVLGTNEMDDFTYHYNDDKNQLNHITDDAPSPSDADDLETQTLDNYEYNEIGQLVKDNEDGVIYEYNSIGLVQRVKQTSGQPILEYEYNDKGQRISKESFNSGGSPIIKTHYIRDLNGNPVAIYEGNNLKEHPIYGNSRLGIHNRSDASDTYQFTDHLGNVRALVQQASDENPIIYEENFNDLMSIEPDTWLPGGYAAIDLVDQKLRVTVTQNWNYTRIRFHLEAGKTYQIKYKIEMESILGQFYALARKVGGGSDWLYHSGSSIQQGGYYTYTIQPTSTGQHELLFGGCRILGYPNGTDFVQPNIFYLDDIEVKDTSVDVIGYKDYYPGGMIMPNRNLDNDYRYGYQGEFAETDEEIGRVAFEHRLYDARINRWLSPDKESEFHSPYKAMGNNWMNLVDVKGDSTQFVNKAGELIATVDDGKKYYTVVYQAQDGFDIEGNFEDGYTFKPKYMYKIVAVDGKWMGSKAEYLSYIGALGEHIGFSKNIPVVFRNSKNDGLGFSYRARSTAATGYDVIALDQKRWKLHANDYDRSRVVLLKSYWNTVNALEHELFHNAQAWYVTFMGGKMHFESKEAFKSWSEKAAVDYQKTLHSWNKATKEFRDGIDEYRKKF